MWALAVLLPIALFGQEDNEREWENALLWKITGNELTAPSYLYGTVHLLCKEDYIEVDGLQKAFDETDQLILEMDVSDMSNSMAIFTSGRMKDGKKLKDVMSEEDYDFLSDFFREEIGMPLAMFSTLKPLLLSSFIPLAGMGEGCEQVSYELNFIEQTKEAGEKVGSLESVKEVMEVMDLIPYERQAELVLETLKSDDAGEEEMNTLMELYKTQNLAGLNDYIRNSDASMDEFGDILVDLRNQNWMDNLEAVMKDKPSLVAVGAGHLPGKGGLLQLLHDAGYTVEAVSAVKDQKVEN